MKFARYIVPVDEMPDDNNPDLVNVHFKRSLTHGGDESFLDVGIRRLIMLPNNPADPITYFEKNGGQWIGSIAKILGYPDEFYSVNNNIEDSWAIFKTEIVIDDYRNAIMSGRLFVEFYAPAVELVATGLTIKDADLKTTLPVSVALPEGVTLPVSWENGATVNVDGLYNLATSDDVQNLGQQISNGLNVNGVGDLLTMQGFMTTIQYVMEHLPNAAPEVPEGAASDAGQIIYPRIYDK